MATGTLHYRPVGWKEINIYGWVERKPPDSYIANAIANRRHGEFVVEHSFDVVEAIKQSNERVEEVTRIKITGLYCEGFFKAETYGCPDFFVANRISISAGGISVEYDVEGDDKWKSNKYTLNIEVPVDSPIIKIERQGIADLGWCISGYLGVGSRNIMLTIYYEYVGPPPPSGELHIYVKEAETYKSIKGANVLLTDSAGNVIDSKVTDENGYCLFIVPEDSYVVIITKTGYKKIERVVDCPGNYTFLLEKPPSPWEPIMPYLPYIVVGGIIIIAIGGAYYLYQRGKLELVRKGIEYVRKRV